MTHYQGDNSGEEWDGQGENRLPPNYLPVFGDNRSEGSCLWEGGSGFKYLSLHLIEGVNR